ncbi:MAG: tetraacyldisaccharide 4'-kinase [Sterolibacterium sp.]|nr:tetraacyldisaccharide 4'-kinase [Sterolibacterium sp.]
MDPARFFLRIWQRRGVLAVLLWPLSLLFGLLSALRRQAYARGWLPTERLPVPVVVVGNIIVGGSGKTPLTLWLADALRQIGWQPGIISRGYAATASATAVREVHDDSAADAVGDEPLLLKRRSRLPVFVGRDRVAAGRALLAAYPDCDVILSDDGLQHYRLQRDMEIALVDGRGLMNGWLLPAGPLREPGRRLAQVAAIVLNGSKTVAPAPAVAGQTPCFVMQLSGATFQRLGASAKPVTVTAAQLQGLKLAAVAGIAVPERFFQHLATLGLQFSRHVFADHHRYTLAELRAIQSQTQVDALLMTEKDAVKCAAHADAANNADHPLAIWVLPVTAQVSSAGDNGLQLAAHVEHYLLENVCGSPTA